MLVEEQPLGGVLIVYSNQVEELMLTELLDLGLKSEADELEPVREILKQHAPEPVDIQRNGQSVRGLLMRDEPGCVILTFMLQAGAEAKASECDEADAGRYNAYAATVIQQVSDACDDIRKRRPMLSTLRARS